ELGVEIALHLRKEIADERLQVRQTCTVLCRHDEAELMRVVLRALEESSAINIIALCIIQPSSFSLTGNTIALDVFDVRSRRAHIASDDARVTSLDDDAAATWCDETGGGTDA